MTDPLDDLRSTLEKARADRGVGSIPAPTTFPVPPEPTWIKCSLCGEQTTRPVCADCQTRRDRARDAREETEAHLPERFRWARFESKELANRTRLLIDRPRVLSKMSAPTVDAQFTLVGASGVGKTTLAVAGIRAWVARHGLVAVFASGSELGTARLRAEPFREAGEVIGAKGAALLLVDDLGEDADTAMNPIKEILQYRYDHARPTWVTTGRTQAEIAKRYGDGIARRVFSPVWVVRFEG